MYSTLNVHEFFYSTSMTSVSRIRNKGAYCQKTDSKGGAYSEGGAYWKEGVKSNHYGIR